MAAVEVARAILAYAEADDDCVARALIFGLLPHFESQAHLLP